MRSENLMSIKGAFSGSFYMCIYVIIMEASTIDVRRINHRKGLYLFSEIRLIGVEA